MMWDEFLNGLGFVFATPGKLVRNVLVGENPFQYSFGDYWYGRDQSPSGRDMLERYGVLGANRPGLDFGDILGGIASLGTDPWSVVPIGRAASAGVSGARAAGAGIRGAATGGIRAAAKPATITGGLYAGMEGLNSYLNPLPQAQSQDDMLAAALLDMMLGSGEEEYV